MEICVHGSVDNVTLGSVTVPQTFAETTTWSTNFNNPDEPMDGIMGFAMQQAAADHQPTVVETLYQKGLISQKTFSFVLQKQPTVQDGSFLIIGPPDTRFYTGILVWNKIVSTTGMWFIVMDGVAVDGAYLSMCTAAGPGINPCVALIDTGTSFIGVPNTRWNALFKAITQDRPDCTQQPSSGAIICSSLSFTNLPVLTFRFKGTDFALQPSDYMLSFDQGMRLAMMNIGATPSTYDRFILGDTFLKTFYTVFDGSSNCGAFLPLSPLVCFSLGCTASRRFDE
jgi:hypothetical protein